MYSFWGGSYDFLCIDDYIEHSSVESLAYALESFQAQEHANQVEHQYGNYSYSPDAERGVKIEQKDLSKRGHRYEKSRDDYGYGM